MASRENLVILGFVLLSLPTAYVVQEMTGRFIYSYAAVIVVGVVIPTLINEFYTYQRTDS